MVVPSGAIARLQTPMWSCAVASRAEPFADICTSPCITLVMMMEVVFFAWLSSHRVMMPPTPAIRVILQYQRHCTFRSQQYMFTPYMFTVAVCIP
jgi:hypothetical protein